MKQKITTFEGYISGDYECFCLSKVPFEEWEKICLKRSKEENVVYPDPLLKYPGDFFPPETKEGQWKFKITVEAEKVNQK